MVYGTLEYHNDVPLRVRDKIVRFLMTGASDLISNSAHFSFITSTGHMILNISGIFKSILKDQYKCPACDKKINPRSVKNPIL